MKPHNLMRLLVVATALAFGSQAMAEELVAQFKGVGSKTTPEFEVKGPWLLDWSVTGIAEQGMGIEIDLVESELLTYRGTVLNRFKPGAGTKMFSEGGRLRFRVNSSFAAWRLRILSITPEEAADMIVVR